MSVWEGGTDIGRSSQRAGSPASGQNGDREDDAGGGGEGGEEKTEGKETCLLPLWEKKEGGRGRRGSGRRSSASNPWKHARWWRGRVVTTAMTAGAVWKGAATGRQARVQARQGTRAGSWGRARHRRRSAAGRVAGRRRHRQQAADDGGDRAGARARISATAILKSSSTAAASPDAALLQIAVSAGEPSIEVVIDGQHVIFAAYEYKPLLEISVSADDGRYPEFKGYRILLVADHPAAI
uniref:Uncharacterized protein n=2 Tax=Oryza sativa subsp. japonica TaxID=39947 RepID=Q10S51_ORYSJ|nr:Hypothetical protein [Oryza sativa Japonica Group]ABF93843.1 transposon protein, putative, unclassified [Oryza sativa Japonica Group]